MTNLYEENGQPIESRYKKLFEPGWLGQMKLGNRFVMAAMSTNLATDEGYVTQRMLDYYEARAKGGVGLVIVEATCVDYPTGKLLGHQLRIDDDSYIPGLTQLARIIQKHGAKAAIQLDHAGISTKAAITGCQPAGPSQVTRPGFDVSRQLTVEEIHQLVKSFAKSAARAQKAGFDGVELHGAHTHLGAQFLSSFWNKRTDEYGGTLPNRARFLLEVVRSIKEGVSTGYPVWCRINSREYGMRNGIKLEEAQQVAQWLQEAGADAIHVSVWGMGRHTGAHRPNAPGALVTLAVRIKKAVTIPIITVGAFDADVGEEVLAHGKADFVAIGRALLADPELPNKVALGAIEDINPCIRCNTCAEIAIRKYESRGEIACSVNPALGKEREYELKVAGAKKKIIVVGAGPAGMVAALVAALRGHDVSLYEQNECAGGQLKLAAISPRKEPIQMFARYLECQVKKAGVRMKFGQEVDTGLIEKEKPDTVVIATGVKPKIPDIPGIERSNVVLAEDVLLGKVHTGKKVVIIGGESVGCETAEFLAHKGKRVSVVRRGPRMATRLVPTVRERLLDRLARLRVEMITGVKYDEVTEHGVRVTTATGKARLLEADNVVLAAGAKSNTGLAQELRGRVKELHLAGDCIKPRRILDAVADGYRVGLAI